MEVRVKRNKIYLLTIIVSGFILISFNIEKLNKVFANKIYYYGKTKKVRSINFKEETTVQGIPCRFFVEFHENGKIKSCRLSKRIKIQGITLARNDGIIFHKNGILSLIRLIQPFLTIQGILIKKGSYILFYDTGQISSIQTRDAKKTLIQKITFENNSVIDLYKNGRIKEYYHPHGKGQRKININGILCKIGDYNSEKTYFYKNGKLKTCYLFENQKVQGVPCSIGSYKPVKFNMKGEIKSCYPSKGVTIGGIPCASGKRATFYNNGAVKSCYLSHKKIIKGIPCDAKTRDIYFYNNGYPKGCHIYKNVRIQGKKIVRGDYIELNENGRIKKINKFH